MKNLVKVLVVITVIVGLLIVLFNSWKEKKAIEEWQSFVQQTISIVLDNTPHNVSDKQLLIMNYKVAVAYCKENHLTFVPTIVLYKEVLTGHYYNIGRYDNG